MKYILAAILSATLFFSPAFGKGHFPQKFKKLVDENGMKFIMPDSFRSVRVKNNPDMGYSYALKHTKKKLEIRYSILPLADLVKNYERSKTDTSYLAVEPNIGFGKTMMFATTYNLADSIIQDITPFDSLASRKEFGADWGAFSFMIPRATFAPDYNYCLLIAIHKDNVADGFIMYLFDDLHDVADDVYKGSFYNLTFK